MVSSVDLRINKKLGKFKIIIGISLLVLIVITVLTWPDDRIRVVFCDVGQGDGVMISQGRFQMLIDTGPENKKMINCLGRWMPFWDRKLEVVIISHWDSDHGGGLKEIMNGYQIEKLFSGTEPEGANEQNIYSGNLRVNDILRYGSINFEVKSSGENWGNENDNSVVGLLNIGKKNILMMGDVTAAVEQKLVWRRMLDLEVEVIKVSHHGSGEATSQELLDKVKPKTAIISVGKNNKFGHPNEELLKRLTERGIEIRRTDKEGDIIYQNE